MKLILIVVICLSVGASWANNLENFETYQKHFNKEYKGRAEAAQRGLVFSQNVAKIVEHNERFRRGEETYSMGINQFTDMTEKEFLKHINGLPKFDERLKEKYPTDQEFVDFLKSKSSVPDSFSWIDEGGVTSVKNQASCGSCTAFACTATLDTCFFKGNGVLYDDLSEQFLVDCAMNHYFGEWGAFGCSGAWPQAYFDYLETVSNGYTQKESSYPYTGTDGRCKSTEQGWYTAAHQLEWKNIWNADEKVVKQWIAEIGPVVTTIYASGQFGSYSGGVLNAGDCCNQSEDPSCSYQNNHAVAVVGYGHENGLDFWLVKNSWGDWWGDNGFIKVKRGTGHCGMFGHSASGPTSC